MSENVPVLVAIATYNEIDNLPQLIDQLSQYVPDVDILIVDDDSPDGTGRLCDEFAARNSRLFCLHRKEERGLGSATISAFRYALDRDYAVVLTMDADLSHPPRYIPDLLNTLANHPADVAIGSRYVAGGGIEGWPLYRRIMSRAVNSYARLLLGLGVKDTSGAFRCYRTEVLRRIDFDAFLSNGYSYLEEILWRLKRCNARFCETPIVFVDRQFGQTKINMKEAASALWIILRLGIRNWLRP